MSDQLSPPGLRPPASSTTASDEGTDRQLHPLVWALLGFVVALGLVVLVMLPSMVTEHPLEPSSAASKATVSKSAAVNLPQPLATGVTRDDAEQALKDFLRLRAQPDLAAAENWAAADWQRALDTALEGDGLYGKGLFSEAQAAYKKAALQLQNLLDNRGARLQGTLAAGWQALGKNEVDDAISAFQRVLAMQSDHEEAATGLARAQVRSRILELMLEGSQAEAENRIEVAGQAYRAALQLDAAYSPAQSASARTEKMLIEARFQLAMSTALQNLQQGRLSAAGTALQAAAAIQPQSPAVKDVQHRLTESRRRAGLQRLRRQAEQKATNEEWQAVADLSRKALAIDANSIAARNSLSHARQRLALNRQLDHYLADTGRLSSGEPLMNARKLLLENSRVPEAEPELTAKIARLQEAVRLAVIPVQLQIQSDGQTDITIYHVGQLGRFAQKQLTLRPGKYTLVGSCTGYRDVRKVIILRPDSGSHTVQLRCEELI